MEDKCLRDIIAKVDERSRQLSQEHSDLRGKINQLESRVSRLEANMQKSVVVGQIAFMIEDAILTYVMKGIADPKQRSLYTIDDLDKAIAKEPNYSDAFESEEERTLAEEQFQVLKSKIGWRNHHFRDLKRLKELRVVAAHPRQESVQEFLKMLGIISN